MSAKTAAAADRNNLVGRAVEDLTVSDRLQYANTWVAFRLYSPPGKVTLVELMRTPSLLVPTFIV